MSSVALVVVTGIVWFFCPESARKELNAISE
jgi:uncharacterized protein YjeT (DUF2065 family)